MIDLKVLDKQCPRCSGLGRTENPQWFHFWTKLDGLKDSFRTLETMDQLTTSENATPDQPTEPMFFICKECHGRGKVLTAEGKQLIEFIRFWMIPNY
ncbi:hypothetical protein [Desulfosporosinus sp. SB140]|uniref:hypothetical protein n=1 Tax=Desulfosporosinus paludis TaxID=3115649 RepID=UPI00388FBE87